MGANMNKELERESRHDGAISPGLLSRRVTPHLDAEPVTL